MDDPRDLLGTLTLVNLGSGGDEPFPLPDWAAERSTLVEVDAAYASRGSRPYARRLPISTVVGAREETRTFSRRAWVESSSLLDPKPELIRKYGLEAPYRLVEASDVKTRRLPDLLAERGVERIDLLKTDLEGLDLEVILSCGALLDEVLVLSCELRFEPFYEGEPNFLEAGVALDGRGFDLLDLKPAVWKPRTANRREQRDGRVTWADCLFIRRLPSEDVGARARQALLLGMLGRHGYAEYVLDEIGALPEGWDALLRPLTVRPRPLPPHKLLRRKIRSAPRRLWQALEPRERFAFDHEL